MKRTVRVEIETSEDGKECDKGCSWFTFSGYSKQKSVYRCDMYLMGLESRNRCPACIANEVKGEKINVGR